MFIPCQPIKPLIYPKTSKYPKEQEERERSKMTDDSKLAMCRITFQHSKSPFRVSLLDFDNELSVTHWLVSSLVLPRYELAAAGFEWCVEMAEKSWATSESTERQDEYQSGTPPIVYTHWDLHYCL